MAHVVQYLRLVALSLQHPEHVFLSRRYARQVAQFIPHGAMDRVSISKKQLNYFPGIIKTGLRLCFTTPEHTLPINAL